MMRWGIYSVMGVFLLSLASCCGVRFSPRVEHVTVSVPRTSEQVVEVEELVNNVESRVKEVLPNSYLSGMIFTGSGRHLDTLDGKFVIDFVQVYPGILADQILVASAAIETEQGAMKLHFRDETDHYWSTNQLDLDANLPLAKIAALGHSQILSMGLEDRTITMTYLQEGTWVVVCGEFGTFERECEFKIDAVTGEIAITQL